MTPFGPPSLAAGTDRQVRLWAGQPAQDSVESVLDTRSGVASRQ